MFILYSLIFDLTYKHIVPTGLKRVRIAYFYKHIVPMGLKTNRVRINFLEMAHKVLQHEKSDRIYIIGEGIEYEK